MTDEVDDPADDGVIREIVLAMLITASRITWHVGLRSVGGSRARKDTARLGYRGGEQKKGPA
ncbi:hypothetical protein BSZ39_03895 [Bowdeniella nasicola]|uniref:Uncharacterized protein n=1 Tax=Bowdeniella nasicola TaxID=208480 RepID=A0A1Q5Q475_9ACTO|nr:hypothetical protein BSZ39_03895 [Bowdeniella nasicola]